MNEHEMNVLCHRLEDFLNDELSDAEGSTFEQHLKRCPACRQAAHLEQEMAARLGQHWSQIAPPEVTLAAEQLVVHARRRQRVGWALSGAAVTAATVLIVIGGFIQWRENPAAKPNVATGPGTVESPRSIVVPDQEGSETTAEDEVAQQARVMLRGASRSNHLSMTRPLDVENATFVMVYQTRRSGAAGTDVTREDR